MSELRDKELTSRIAEVFENYDDAGADNGWALLRERFPEKKKDRGIIWWYSAAAGLLVFMGLFWFLNKPGVETVAYKPSVKSPRTATPTSQQHTDTLHAANGKPAVRSNIPAMANAIAGVHKSSPFKTGTRTKQLLNGQSYTAVPWASNHPVITRSQAPISAKPFNEVLTGQINHDSLLNNIDATASNKKQTRLADSIPAPLVASANAKPADADKQTDPVLKMMAQDNTRQARTNKLATINKKESLVALSPYAATYFNYAKGSNTQVNVGAGITTDFKISKNIRFSTGVAVAQNTLSYSNGAVPPNLAANAATAVYANPVANANATNLSFIGSTTSVTGYKADLLGLDVPVNVKYQFDPAKSDTYISAGISSGTFINETYSSVVQLNSFSNATSPVSQTISNNSHFGGFYFARTLNVSFGVGYPVGKNHIVIEPFLKYPLGGLGAQNIQFGASGINFKLNLGNSKK